jgi:hypothetical protein
MVLTRMPSTSETSKNQAESTAAGPPETAKGRLPRWVVRFLIPFFVAAIVVAFFYGFMAGVRGEQAPPSSPPLAIKFFIPAVIAYLLSVAVHETGHAIGGVIAGFKLLTFAVWPAKLYRHSNTWRVGWMGSTGLGGFVAADPLEEQNFARRAFLLVAAGPAASALIGTASAIFAANTRSDWPSWATAELNLFACWSLLIAVSTILPLRSRYAVNDGMRMGMLLRGGAETDRFRSILILAGRSYSGIRPRDLNPDLMRLASVPDDGSPDALAGRGMRYNWLLDAGRIEEADQVLASIATGNLPKLARTVWWCEVAWFEARFRGDLALARRWFDAAPALSRPAWNRCARSKAQAAIAFLEQRWADAETAAREACKDCDQLADSGTAGAIRENL